MDHYPGCQPAWRNIKVALPQKSQAFILHEHLMLNVDGNELDPHCDGCCRAFLEDRIYSVVPQMPRRKVVFRHPPAAMVTRCFLDFSNSSNPQHGQVAIDPPEPGVRFHSVVKDGHTWHLYTDDRQALAFGVHVLARVVRISVDKLKVGELCNARLELWDAALLELYRHQHKMPSLKGFVHWAPLGESAVPKSEEGAHEAAAGEGDKKEEIVTHRMANLSMASVEGTTDAVARTSTIPTTNQAPAQPAAGVESLKAERS